MSEEKTDPTPPDELDKELWGVTIGEYTSMLGDVIGEWDRINLARRLGVITAIDAGHRLTICMIVMAELSDRLANEFLSKCNRETLTNLITTYFPGGVKVELPPCFFDGIHTSLCPHPNG